MAKRSVDGASQSAFIREHLNADRDVKHRLVADGWTAAGHPGEIKSSLFYLVKSKMGLAKGKTKKLGRPAKEVPATASPPKADATVGDSLTAYHEIERALDSLIHRAAELRDAKLAAELRTARRRVSVQLV